MRSHGLWGGRESKFHLQHNIDFLKNIKAHLPHSLYRAVERNLIKNQFNLIWEYLKEGNLTQAEERLSQILQPKSFWVLPKRKFLSLITQIKFPKFYTSLKAFRNSTLGEPPPI